MRTNRTLRNPAVWSLKSPTRSVTTALAATILTLVLVTGPSFPVVAQQPAANSNAETRKLAHLLIKNALISVNQGNLTGNYTVLRDLASPGFRERNSASDLGSIFANLRQQKIDLSPIVLIDPVITQSKFIKEQNQLRLAGYRDAPSGTRSVSLRRRFPGRQAGKSRSGAGMYCRPTAECRAEAGRSPGSTL